MKAIINGQDYDTDEAEGALGGDSGHLYRPRRGDFFLIEIRDSPAGREAYPHQRTDPKATIREMGHLLENYRMAAEAESRPDDYWKMVKHWEILIPFRPKQAMEWAIKEAMLDCFKGYLLESL